MIRNRALILQYCRFAAVGITSLMVDYIVMIFLAETTMDYFGASAFSYTVSVFVNYILSMKYVFHSRDDMSRTKEATIFFLLSLVGLGLNQIIMWYAVDVLHIYYTLAKLLSTALVTNYNFISRKKFFN